jgi:DNA-binding NtrC family response regulator
MHILVVEDDDGVRRLLHLVLTEAGHAVKNYGNAEDAIRSRAEIERADLIIADARLPGMSGIDFAMRVRGYRPSACVLVITGFAEDPKITTPVRRLNLHVLEKPFTPETLLAIIARICGPGAR